MRIYPEGPYWLYTLCLLHNSNIVVDNRRQMPQWEIQEVRSYCMQGKRSTLNVCSPHFS